MRLLLDTNAFLWMLGVTGRLSPRAREMADDRTNECILSSVSVWEIAIKYGTRRLTLPEHPSTLVPTSLRYLGITPLPVEFEHSYRVADLPHHHRDPFDRMLVAQAQVEGLPILTPDKNIARYDVEVIW